MDVERTKKVLSGDRQALRAVICLSMVTRFEYFCEQSTPSLCEVSVHVLSSKWLDDKLWKVLEASRCPGVTKGDAVNRQGLSYQELFTPTQRRVENPPFPWLPGKGFMMERKSVCKGLQKEAREAAEYLWSHLTHCWTLAWRAWLGDSSVTGSTRGLVVEARDILRPRLLQLHKP